MVSDRRKDPSVALLLLLLGVVLIVTSKGKDVWLGALLVYYTLSIYIPGLLYQLLSKLLRESTSLLVAVLAIYILLPVILFFVSKCIGLSGP
jgi:hypothetical protein